MADSRGQSPQRNGSGAKKDFPSLTDVKAAIPPEGIEIKTLVGLFKLQVAGRNAEFIQLVKSAGQQDKATQKIMPKP